jgi:ribosomal protein L28
LPSLACDGAYLYILGTDGLVKLGTGCQDTIQGHVYSSNKSKNKDKDKEKELQASTKRRWLASVAEKLYLYVSGETSMHVLSIYTLKEEALLHLSRPCDVLVSDGNNIFCLVKQEKGVVIDVYDPAAQVNSMCPVRVIEVQPPKDNQSQPLAKDTQQQQQQQQQPPVEVIPSLYIEKGGWYVTGRQLVCVLGMYI